MAEGNIWASILRGIINALDQEITALHQQGGSRQVELTGGEYVGTAEKYFLYRFPLPDELHLRDETPVRITCGQEVLEGIIVSVRDGWLVLALEKDLGSVLPQARLVIEESFLIERLRDRFLEIGNGNGTFHPEAALRVIGQAPITPGCREPDPESGKRDGLNAEQRKAVAYSLGSDTLFIWGPPGTGKTTTLARIVESFYRAGSSVLLVSNTNIAVDTALEKIAARLEGDPGFQNGAVIRYGPVLKEELAKFKPYLSLEEVIARRGEYLAREKEEIEGKFKQSERESRSLQAALAEIEEAERYRARLEIARKKLTADKETYILVERERQEAKSRLQELTAKKERAQGMGVIRRFFAGYNLERLAAAMAEVQAIIEEKEARGCALAAAIATQETSLAALVAEVSQLTSRLKNYPAKAACQARLQDIEKTRGQLQARLKEIEAKLNSLREEILKECRIMATTVYRTYLQGSPERDFDVVIIDEASMLMLPLALYAAGLARKTVIVAGDFRQLPPIVRAQGEAAEEWLRQDVFTKAGIPAQVAGELPPHLIALKEQYRMREEICDCINTLFYPDYPLVTASAPSSAPAFPLASAPLLYLDTSDFHPWTGFRAGGYSRYNLFHALLIRNFVFAFGADYLAKGQEGLGIITPYAAQSQLIRALLVERLGRGAVGLVDTVHRFQGNEKELIILDLPDSTGARLGKFMSATEKTEEGARLLNVAVSRARSHVLLIANFTYLREHTPGQGIIRELLAYFERHGEALPVERILPGGETDWAEAVWGKKRSGWLEIPEDAIGVFNEGTFYPAFAQDLREAQETIVIFSPFLTAQGVARWVELLRAALARGVKVRLVTRPPGSQGGSLEEGLKERIYSLREIGITVDLFAHMHEKLAFIDGKILWSGSLNIMSHSRTSEVMFRLASGNVYHLLARFRLGGNRSGEEPDLSRGENPPCPLCGGHTIGKGRENAAGNDRLYFECEQGCGGRVVPEGEGKYPRSGFRKSTLRQNSTEDILSEDDFARTSRQGKPCPRPGCNGRLVLRHGRYGPFLGCTNYPVCKETENIMTER